MSHFSPDFNQFFMDLAPNNHKDWFDQNRNRYHSIVKAPFEAFVAEVIERVKVYEPHLDLVPAKAIFRINRDIRFSKDKSPYKLNRSALVGKYGRKEMGHPSLYIELGPERVYLAGGAYMPTKDQLQAIREAIAGDIPGWRAAIAAKPFVQYWGAVRGEANKRLPDAALTKAAETEPMIYQKQFYYEAQLGPEWVVNPHLVDQVMAHYEAAQTVHQFLEKALIGG